MPFTFAHPAIVLPLKQLGRGKFSLTALVIGSLAPDFEYFIRLETRSTISHTIAGVFLFDLPLTFLLSLLFHVVIRDPVIDHLPTGLHQQAASYRSRDWIKYLRKNVWVFMFSACLGSLSHIFWDAFTHDGGYFVQLWPALDTRLLVLYGYDLYVYKMLQHGSTLLGFIVIAMYIYRLPRNKDNSRNIDSVSYFWGWVVLITACFPVARLIFLGLGKSWLSTLVVTTISSNMLALVIVSIVYRQQKNR